MPAATPTPEEQDAEDQPRRPSATVGGGAGAPFEAGQGATLHADTSVAAAPAARAIAVFDAAAMGPGAVDAELPIEGAFALGLVRGGADDAIAFAANRGRSAAFGVACAAPNAGVGLAALVPEAVAIADAFDAALFVAQRPRRGTVVAAAATGNALPIAAGFAAFAVAPAQAIDALSVAGIAMLAFAALRIAGALGFAAMVRGAEFPGFAIGGAEALDAFLVIEGTPGKAFCRAFRIAGAALDAAAKAEVAGSASGAIRIALATDTHAFGAGLAGEAIATAPAFDAGPGIAEVAGAVGVAGASLAEARVAMGRGPGAVAVAGAFGDTGAGFAATVGALLVAAAGGALAGFANPGIAIGVFGAIGDATSEGASAVAFAMHIPGALLTDAGGAMPFAAIRIASALLGAGRVGAELPFRALGGAPAFDAAFGFADAFGTVRITAAIDATVIAAAHPGTAIGVDVAGDADFVGDIANRTFRCEASGVVAAAFGADAARSADHAGGAIAVAKARHAATGAFVAERCRSAATFVHRAAAPEANHALRRRSAPADGRRDRTSQVRGS